MTKYADLIKKRVQDFPDYEKVVGPKNMSVSDLHAMQALANPDLSIVAPPGEILPTSTLSEMIVKGSLQPEKKIQITRSEPIMSRKDVSPYFEEQFAPGIGDLGLSVRNILGNEIAKEIIKRKIDPASQLANPKDLSLRSMSEKEQKESGSAGFYDVETGKIAMGKGHSPEKFISTLTHEIGHKAHEQGLGIEGLPVGIHTYSPEQAAATASEIPRYKEMPRGAIANVFDLLNVIKKHHGKVLKEPWETATLRNIKEKGILREPLTEEIPKESNSEYLRLIKKFSKEKRKYNEAQEKINKLMGGK